MIARLVALDDGPDIDLDRAMVVVGRHPACDARLDSLRVSRHHCCMTQDNGEVLVRDLGSTNGIRINGQRVEMGRLRAGDELSIAHIRYRLDDGAGHEKTLSDSSSAAALRVPGSSARPEADSGSADGSPTSQPDENAMAAAVRKILPSSMAHRCRIQVIVRMDDEENSAPHPTPVGMTSSHSERAAE